MAAGEYFQMPDRNLFGETVLAPNELMTHVILPRAGPARASRPTKSGSSSRTTGRWRSHPSC